MSGAEQRQGRGEEQRSQYAAKNDSCSRFTESVVERQPGTEQNFWRGMPHFPRLNLERVFMARDVHSDSETVQSSSLNRLLRCCNSHAE